MWDNVQDPTPVYRDGASPGPRLGFLGALEASYEDQVRNSSLDGLAYHFMKADEDQATEACKNGVEYQPFYKRPLQAEPDPTTGEIPMQGSRSYYRIARTLVDNEDNNVLPDFADHDAKIIENNEKGGYKLKTMGELFNGVREQSRKAKERADLDWTLGGYAGGIIGSVAGSMDPRTDPLNFITAPLGGAGKTVFTRIAAQAGIQGVTEGINQISGVQENRRLLGLDYGVSNAAFSVLGAAAGGALLQGAGEAVGAGVRRYATGKWFADAPNDVAPPAPALERYDPLPPVEQVDWLRLSPQEKLDAFTSRSPLSDSRIGRPRAEADMLHVRNVLSDWGGPKPIDIPPQTATRLPGAEPTTNFKLEFKQGPETLDSIARRVDPEAFGVYDKYAAIKNEARAQLDAMGADRNSNANKAVQDVQDQIDELRQKTDGANRKNAKKYGVRIAELERQRDSFLAVETRTDTPEMAEVRKQLMEADEQMRDMSPAVTRAYASAQNKWNVYEEQRKQIAQMIRDGGPGIDRVPTEVSTLPKDPPAEAFAPRDPIPERASGAAVAKPGEALATTIDRLNVQVQQAVDDALDTFSAYAKTATKEVAEGAEKETHIALTVNGKEYKMPLDGTKISVPLEDGSVVKLTPRELLKEVHNDNEALQAITSCSLNATS